MPDKPFAPEPGQPCWYRVNGKPRRGSWFGWYQHRWDGDEWPVAIVVDNETRKCVEVIHATDLTFADEPNFEE